MPEGLCTPEIFERFIHENLPDPCPQRPFAPELVERREHFDEAILQHVTRYFTIGHVA